MNIDGLDIDSTIKEVELALKNEKNLSLSLRSMMNMLLLMVKLLTNRVNTNSSNSSKPPSSDPNRLKSTRAKTDRNTV